MTQSPITPIDGLRSRRGADVLLEILRSEGVDYIFGNPGTTELPLMDALIGERDIRYIWALQEASAVAMADGYAQAARRPGFLNLHTAGGLGHGMGNLLNAQASQTPLVVTAGQQDSRHTITDPLLFGDLIQIARPAVKWAQEVAHADQLPVLVRRAFHDANAAPAGPVFLSLPMDVMEEMSTIGIADPSVIDRQTVAGSLDQLAARLAAITPGRLLIIAGDEVYGAEAAAEVARVAEMLGAPVYGSSWPSRLPFPTAHPLWAGNMPNKGREIYDKLTQYDAIFALGGKSLITILYSAGPIIPASCAVYQMSTDVRDLGRTYSTQLSVVGDIRASLRAMLPFLAKRRPLRAPRPMRRCSPRRRWTRHGIAPSARHGPSGSGRTRSSRLSSRRGRPRVRSGRMSISWTRRSRPRCICAASSTASRPRSIPSCAAALWAGACPRRSAARSG